MDDLEKVRFFDLGNVAVSLKKSLEFKLLVNKIRQLQDISSIEIDLRYARDDLNCCIDLGCLEPLDFEKPQNPRDARVIGALFVQSLVYYTRATKSESRHRGFAPITRNWTPELKNVHSDIVKIRDDIVAHFGTYPLASVTPIGGITLRPNRFGERDAEQFDCVDRGGSVVRD